MLAFLFFPSFDLSLSRPSLSCLSLLLAEETPEECGMFGTNAKQGVFDKRFEGHIALDQAVFPENVPGFVLDTLARCSLWKIGLDYRHRTGHGVGAALNVHEGPQSISFRYGNTTGLQRGMIISNEPGYYEDHSFGIRIENLLCVKEIEAPNYFGGIGYLGFEKFTFVPIQYSYLLLRSIGSTAIMNKFGKKVAPLVEGHALKWLWNNSRPLPAQ